MDGLLVGNNFVQSNKSPEVYGRLTMAAREAR